MALDRWFSLSEPSSLHLKMRELVYSRVLHSFRGIDSSEYLVSSVATLHFDLHIIPRGPPLWVPGDTPCLD